MPPALRFTGRSLWAGERAFWGNQQCELAFCRGTYRLCKSDPTSTKTNPVSIMVHGSEAVAPGGPPTGTLASGKDAQGRQVGVSHSLQA